MSPTASVPSKIHALYVHIPFCRHLCPFCAFAVRKDRANAHQAYLDSLLVELKLRKTQLVKELGEISVIYFGGGTPSSLTIPEVQDLINGIGSHLNLSNQVEISFEVNPEDASTAYFAGLAECGISRISLGGQSFQADTLTTLDRNHTVEHLQHALEDLHSSPIQNFNLDLMFGVPQQSLESFQADIACLEQHQPQHVSLYALDIEPDTPFAHQQQKVDWVENHRALTRDMYLWAVERLKSYGIFQYEVSNFARKGHESQSNLGVWSGAPYLGLGVGAHSFVNQRRWANHRSLRPYQAALSKESFPESFHETLTHVQQANEMLMLGLRQTQGFSVQRWEENFDLEWPSAHRKMTDQLIAEGLAQWNPPNLQLTPSGLLMADEITASFLLEE